MGYLGLSEEARRRPPRRRPWVAVLLVVLAASNVVRCITEVVDGDYVGAAFAAVTAVLMLALFAVASGWTSRTARRSNRS